MNKSDAQAAIKQAAHSVIAEKEHPRPQPFGQVSIEQYSGPLPSPDVLKRYSEAVPNGAERIMSMAEREQKHFHVLQNYSVALTFMGEVFGWSIIVLAMVGAFYLVMKDKRIEGTASFLSALALLAAGYFSRQKPKGAQQQSRQQMSPQQYASPQPDKPN